MQNSVFRIIMVIYSKSNLDRQELCVKKFVTFIVALLVRIAFWFRYRLSVKGLENLNPETLKNPGGVLFLPNHPSVFIDPASIMLAAYPKYKIRPMVVEYMYYIPVVNWVLRNLDSLPVPNFSTSSNSIKRKRSDEVTKAVINGLQSKDNFLIYPAGKCKDTGVEILGGASAVHHIIQNSPNANIVLVRIKGLWGSSFSKAFTGFTPPLVPTLKRGIKAAFKNLLFFSPRRKVIVEFFPAPPDFPRNGSRLEMNHWLENWYNKPDGLTLQKGDLPGDSLVLVSSSMWGEVYPELKKANEADEAEIQLETIPKDVQQKVNKKVAEMAEVDQKLIRQDMNLATDLGLDSIDIAELLAFLQDTFEVENVPPQELTTVGKLQALASKQIVRSVEGEEEKVDLSKWEKGRSKKYKALVPQGDTIPEVFLRTCDKMGNTAACADMRAGVLTYSQLKTRVLLLADYIKDLPGEYVGILLPASVAASVLILATQLAGKVPLMVNWTVGSKHLESVASLSQVQTVLTSWTFLDRLDNVDLTPIEKQLVMLEDVRGKFGLAAKLKALFRSKLSAKTILRIFKANKIDPHSKAVLLFTSGTESMPKGVPLTHFNILSNQRPVLEMIDIYSTDVLYGLLPPFHSFGFTVSTLLGLLAGVRIAFSPDPTDGKRLAQGFARWGVTIMIGAPTFIKGMLKAGKPEDFKTMRMCVTGAEKAPQELFQLMKNIDKDGLLIEGYGITECSPVLTANQPGDAHIGVGTPLKGIELLIVHPETHEVLPVNTQGLILARGPNIFSGYINPGISSPFMNVNGQDWYKTGDLGFLDETNHLTISGRLKRFIKLGAEMVSLASIEDALHQYTDKKQLMAPETGASLAVCAKEIAGEKTKIYLFSVFDLDLDDVNKFLRDYGFSNIIKISSVTKLDEIPLMGTGKVNYRAIESQYLK